MRKLRIVFSVACLIFSCSLLFVEQASTQAKFDPSKYLLGFVKEDKGHPVVQLWQAAFLIRAQELGYSAELYCGESTDIAETVALAEQGIARGVKGIVTVAEYVGYYPFIKKAGDAGIPVVMCHTTLKSQAEVPGCKAFVAANNDQTGVDAAIAIGEKIGGKGTVAITQGGFNSTENSCASGFIKTMKGKYPNITVLDVQLETYDPAQAVAIQARILRANKDVVAAFSTTGMGPSNWAKAAEQTGKKDGEVVIIGMDYLRKNLDLVKAGKVYAVMGQPLWEEVTAGVNLIDKLLRGENVEFANLLPAPVITKEKVDPYYAILDKVEAIFRK